MSDRPPRIAPGSRREIGALNSLITAAIARGAGTRRPPNVFTTLARHRSLFRLWLLFAGGLMPGGKLPRADTELVILRVAHLRRSEYERRHHERIGRAAGLSGEQIAHTADAAPDWPGWSARQALLLRATDTLHCRDAIADDLWAELAAELSDAELIELCLLVGHYEMLAGAIEALGIEPDGDAARAPAGSPARPLAGRRVLITGAARGIGAEVARRLHSRGARVALAGIEAELLAQVAAECGGAPWLECDVRDRSQVEAAVAAAVEVLGGLDVVIANAGVAAQLPIIGGDAEVFERTVEVNLLGVYYTLRAAGPHISHSGGYALAISSLAAAVHPPLLGAYSASKAGVEALGNALRTELAPSGARVGVAYFAELDTDMTSRGFGTEAARRLLPGGGRWQRVTPLAAGVDAIERGIVQRRRRVVAPRWVAAVLPVREIAQRIVEAAVGRRADAAVRIAREEHAPLTTALPPG